MRTLILLDFFRRVGKVGLIPSEGAVPRCFLYFRRSIPPEVLEPVRRQRRVDRGAGDRPMPEPSLGCPCVVALVGEGVAAGVAQHVRMRLEIEAARRTCSTAASNSTWSHRRSQTSAARSPWRKARRVIVASRCPCRLTSAASFRASTSPGVRCSRVRSWAFERLAGASG